MGMSMQTISRIVVSLIWICAILLVAIPFSEPGRADEADGLLSRIALPSGFRIAVYAQLPRPRSLAVDENSGTVYVGSRHGAIHALRDKNGDGVAEQVFELANGLNVPNGIDLLDGHLYVALNDDVVRFAVEDAEDAVRASGPDTVFNGFPAKFMHGWRYARFGPDGRFYVAIGAPCNICKVNGLEGTILRMNPDGGEVEIVARGVRNSVGFDWHPETGLMYFTDNGGDGMGDDIPPDELNRITAKGQHFGYPYLGGRSVPLTGFETATPPAGAVAPVVEFQAHTANLGIRFYTGTMFPADYRGDAFVAQHGSWDRSERVGYRVMRIRFDENGNVAGKEVFADGWLKNGEVVGRPVDVAMLPDGSIIVSDDYSGFIYRITYRK